MINIAVCDDDSMVVDTCFSMIQEYVRKNEIEVWVEKYTSGEELRDRLISTDIKYDIYFLDIDLGNVNGIDVARYIRDIRKDNVCQIIFVSSYNEYAMQLFEVRPMNFLIKPLQKKQMNAALDKALELINIGVNIFTWKNGSNILRENYSNIMYFESFGRKILIHTVNEIFEFYGRLKDIYHQVSCFKFTYISRSVIVNMNYVKTVKSNEIILLGGERMNMGRNYKNEVYRQLIK